ncbi:MAG: chemotaxis protein CheW [Anaerolineales bacterium]|nr:chemotaxis protein CheW [Anaerolineales bacterium]
MDSQIVSFDLNKEHYGVDIANVEGIIKLQRITTVPGAPAYVEGVTNLRGKILPVIDLRRRFGLPRAEATVDTRIVIVRISTFVVGLVVDAVSEVLVVDPATVEPPSPLAMTTDSTFVKAIARFEGRLVILLDLDAIIADQVQVPA